MQLLTTVAEHCLSPPVLAGHKAEEIRFDQSDEGDEGSTVRSFATNALVNPQGSTAIPLAIQQFPDSSTDGQHNLLVVLSQTVSLADEQQKQSGAAVATSVEPKMKLYLY